MQERSGCIEEDEIDLRELWATLQKRKMMIAGVTLLITLLSVVYVFSLKPIYAAKAMVEIGQINQKFIEPLKEIQTKLSFEYNVGKSATMPSLQSISIPKGATGILNFEVYGHDNATARTFLEKILSEVTQKYQQKTDLYLQNQKRLIAINQQKLDETTKKLKKMQQDLLSDTHHLQTLKKGDTTLAAIYAIGVDSKQKMILDLQNRLDYLQSQQQSLELSISDVFVKPTQRVGNIALSDFPIKPKKKLIVVVAFVTGLILSIFLAFLLEFIAGMKQEQQEN